MKKAIILLTALVLAVILTSCENISFATETDRANNRNIKPTENVYEEIWNLVLKESKDKSTILVNIGTDSYSDYDFWAFSKVIIDNRLSLAFRNNNEGRRCLRFQISNPDSSYVTDDIVYIYDPEAKTLYGEDEESFLMDLFLSDYFEVAGTDSQYSIADLGSYTFVYSKPICENYPKY